ncbi:hypothetical protein ACT8ZV_19920 [Nocardioides sp. MAHUQ-72]|uniref:hypothetical protein n=1 Tax=unclassified Nocardioides TaxID=2615069 RepID=UPI003609C07F
MHKRTMAAVVAAVLTCSTVGAAEAAPAPARSATSITGQWKGAVQGDDGGPAGYTAKVTITRKDGKLHGKVVYPDLCSGNWVYKGKKNGWFRFREVITKDPGAATCVSPVAVKTRRKGEKLRVVWREPESGDTGYMTAHRR